MRIRFFAVNLLNLFVAVVEGFLALRFLLKLFGASPTAPFVRWVYDMSGVLLEPFRGIFSTTTLNNKFVLEFATLFAMLMYAILAMILIYVINLLASVPTHREVVAADRKR